MVAVTSVLTNLSMTHSCSPQCTPTHTHSLSILLKWRSRCFLLISSNYLTQHVQNKLQPQIDFFKYQVIFYLCTEAFKVRITLNWFAVWCSALLTRLFPQHLYTLHTSEGLRNFPLIITSSDVEWLQPLSSPHFVVFCCSWRSSTSFNCAFAPTHLFLFALLLLFKNRRQFIFLLLGCQLNSLEKTQDLQQEEMIQFYCKLPAGDT